MISAPTIRSRFTLLISLSVLFWFISSLVLFDRINRIVSFDRVRGDITNLRYNITQLNLESDKLISHFNSLSAGSSEDIRIDKTGEICMSLKSGLNELNSVKPITGNLILQRYITDALNNVNETQKLTGEFAGLFNERGDIGRGLINQWYTLFLSLQNIRSGALSPGKKALIDRVSVFSMNYLLSRNPDELEKLIDYWKFESLNADPGNSGEFEVEKILRAYYESTNLLSALYRKAGGNAGSGLQSEIRFYLLQLDHITQNLEKESALIFKDFSQKMLRRYLLFIIFFGGFVIVVFYKTLAKTNDSVTQLKNFLKEMKSGKIPENLVFQSSDDLNDMARSLNEHVESLNRKISFADQIGESHFQMVFETEGSQDVLGNSLLKMADRLHKAENEETIHKNEEEKRRWLSEGMAGFGEIFRSERENLEELAFKVIKNLVKYIDANQGTIYLNNQDESTPVVDMVATFAFDRRKYINRRIQYGEGLIGTCALEKETIYLTEIPQDYLEISSGIGEAQPRCLLIVPLKLENELFGILEIASFHKLETYEIAFVEQLGESIATTLAGVRINEKTVRLLEKSQNQAEEMARQEEKMRKNMQELQDAQEESRRKETEITGILNAVNSSSLVAEYSTSGRFADMNEKFLFLLESPRDQVIGKHHSDFSMEDKYSDEYKNFWKRLRDGESISKTEHFRLFKGNEIWLNQTYTPILDSGGKPYKILNIAHDITQSKKLQESLEFQANEIERQNLEMKTLNSAVDASIIKCELSGEGIIMDVNDNYLDATGYSRKEILGKNLRLFLKDSEKQQFEKVWSELLKEKSYTGVIRRTKPSGEEIWLMATFSPVKNEEGEIYKTFFLAHDITEKKLRYQLLEDANKEIDRLKQMIIQLENH